MIEAVLIVSSLLSYHTVIFSAILVIVGDLPVLIFYLISGFTPDWSGVNRWLPVELPLGSLISAPAPTRCGPAQSRCQPGTPGPGTNLNWDIWLVKYLLNMIIRTAGKNKNPFVVQWGAGSYWFALILNYDVCICVRVFFVLLENTQMTISRLKS